MGVTNDILKEMKTVAKKSWFGRLFDMNDESVSSTNVFLFVLTFVGIVLLTVPVIVLLTEIYYNHTISSDISGIAAYITAVVGLFATGGITKSWSNYSSYKYNIKKYGHANLLNSDNTSESDDSTEDSCE